ncbi:MAG: hypothetical protein ACHQAX_08205 [Gammaproteobacteria bacterium]
MKIQAQFFSKFLSEHLGFSIKLRPSQETHLNQPLHFMIESALASLSDSQKQEVLNWLMLNRPDWIKRWWRDEGFDANVIDMDTSGQLCIQSRDLLKTTFSLDPNHPILLKDMGERLSDRYKTAFEMMLNDDRLFLRNTGNFFDHKWFYDSFYTKLDKDIKNVTGLEVIIGSGFCRFHESLRVTPVGSPLIKAATGEISLESGIDHRGSSTEIFQRFNKLYLQQFKLYQFNSIIFSGFPKSLNALITFTNTNRPGYIPAGPVIKFPYDNAIKTHPQLLETRWKPLGLFFNGVRLDNQETDSSPENKESSLPKMKP